MKRLTLLSLSLGGSIGSVAVRFGGDGEEALGFSTAGEASTLAFGLSSFTVSAGGDGLEAAFSDFFSVGAAGATPSVDFEMTAIFVPGSTVSPSLATYWQEL